MKQVLLNITQRFQQLIYPVAGCMITLLVLNQSVLVQWLPNSEKDLAGYKIYYGKSSRSYSRVITAGLQMNYRIDNLQSGYEYFFAVSAYDTAGNESSLSGEVSIFLAENGDVWNFNGHKNAYNFPNPFNPDKEFTQLRYFLKKSGQVSIEIFDVTGNRTRILLKNKFKTPGEHFEDVWDGRDEHGKLAPNGIYYAHVTSESLNQYITIAVTR